MIRQKCNTTELLQLRTRSRKEYRQLMKERRSGLFEREEVVTLSASANEPCNTPKKKEEEEEEDDIDILGWRMFFFYRYIYDFLFSYLRQSLILFSFFLFLYRSLSFFIISNRFWIHWYFSNWKYRKILLLLVFWPKNSKVWTVSNHLQFVVILYVVLVLYLLKKICNSETSSSHFHLRNYINFLWFLITGFEFSCFFLLFFHWYFDSKLGSFIYRYKWHLASLRRLQSCLNMSYCKF